MLHNTTNFESQEKSMALTYIYMYFIINIFL